MLNAAIEAPLRKGQEARDLSRQPGNSLQRLWCRAVPETEGQGNFPPTGTFQAKPGCCPWSGRLGLAWNQTPLQEGLLFLQRQRDASKDDSVVIKASLS